MNLSRRAIPAPLVAVVFWVALSITYLPVLITPFGFLDAYTQLFALTDARSASSPAPWELQHTWAIGRPTCALLMDLFYQVAGSIPGLRIIRLCSVALLALLATSLSRLLSKSGWSGLESASLSFLVVTLPAFEVYASWTSTAPYVVACLLSILAATIARRGGTTAKPGRMLATLSLAAAMQTVAFTIYQPAAMFYVVAAAAVLLRPKPSGVTSMSEILPLSSVLAIALVFGFLIYHLGMYLYPAGVLPSRSGISVDVFHQLGWFVKSPLRDALNFHSLGASNIVAVVSGTTILAGFVVYFRGPLSRRLLYFAATLAMVPASYIPNLVSRESWSAYRTQPALSALLLLFLGLALRSLLKKVAHGYIWKVAVSAAVVIGGVTAFQNTLAFFARPQMRELQAVRQFLAANDTVWEGELVIRPAHWGDSLAPFARYDEFGVPTTCAPWTIEPMIRLIAREMHIDTDHLSVRVLPPAGEKGDQEESVTIDMRSLLNADPSRPPNP